MTNMITKIDTNCINYEYNRVTPSNYGARCNLHDSFFGIDRPDCQGCHVYIERNLKNQANFDENE